MALSLPRTTEHLVRGRWKFRVGAIVLIATRSMRPTGPSLRLTGGKRIRRNKHQPETLNQR